MLLGLAQADSVHRYQALVGATLIDGTGRASRPDATVLIENEHIRAVGNKPEVAIPKNAKVFDVSGKWIVPGLVDAHVHFFQSGGLYTRPDVIDLRAVRPYEKEIAGIRERLPATLAHYLASGVTSVVDMGGPNWTLEVRELEYAGPAGRGGRAADFDDPALSAEDRRTTDRSGQIGGGSPRRGSASEP